MVKDTLKKTAYEILGTGKEEMSIKSEIDIDGLSWVVVDDAAWETAQMTDYVNGMPIYVKRP